MHRDLQAPGGPRDLRDSETRWGWGGGTIAATSLLGQAAPGGQSQAKPQGLLEGKQEYAQKKGELPTFDQSPGWRPRTLPPEKHKPQ